MDKITEAIAHFIGVFEITLEQARLRKAYDEFVALRELKEDAPDLPNFNVNVKAAQDFVGFNPNIPYLPLEPTIVPLLPDAEIDHRPPHIPVPDIPSAVLPVFIFPDPAPKGSSGHLDIKIEPLGSVAVIINQEIALTDNDYVGAGGHGQVFRPVADHQQQMAALVEEAAALSPIDHLEMPGSAEEAVAFIATATELLKAYPGAPATAVAASSDDEDGPRVTQGSADTQDRAKDPLQVTASATVTVTAKDQDAPGQAHTVSITKTTDSQGNSEQTEGSYVKTSQEEGAVDLSLYDGEAEVFVVKAETLEGTYVNGEIVAEAPVVDDYLPQNDEEEEAEEEPTEGPKSESGQVAIGQGTVSVEVSVELQAGGNTLVNTATLTNNWVAGPVFAAMGDNIEVNAIVQINVWSDTDLVSSSIGDWALDSDNPTQGFNIATFQRVDPSATAEADTPAGEFPKHWAVTEITGDLLIVNWIEQFGFVMDDDVAILSASGAKTTVTTGENTAVNDITLEELGMRYDLIIVGGSIYDANFIHQTNILLDNDLIGAVEGFETTGEGSVSTEGNLVWNQATIINVGGADRFEDMPEHYRQAAEELKAGNENLPDGILSDSGFAGLGALRVLYISGDFLNLQYIKQTTILGDSDEVALTMNALQAHPEAAWTLSTGSNALMNFAGILDVDATGKTYVGGDHYSDEILIQAELISTDHALAGQNPDLLISEAIAFLSDDAPGYGEEQPLHHSSLVPDPSQGDVMQSMLA